MRIPTLLGWPWQALAGQTMDWIVNYGLEHGLEEYGLGCGLECGLQYGPGCGLESRLEWTGV